MGLRWLSPRKRPKIAAIVTLVFLVLLLRWTTRGKSWPEAARTIGLGGEKGVSEAEPRFQPGTPAPPGHKYSRVLVMPKMQDDNMDWVDKKIPDVQTAIYTADDPSAPLHPPANKGNEVMTYLTYIIDTYDNLPDVILFMHSHRFGWHNNDILNSDASEMINRLSSERVIREGYMNLRCHWYPGCPDWIRPSNRVVDKEKKEEQYIRGVWNELFPLDDLPDVLSQPCCSQFALSRERILTIPRSKFIFYRDWLLKTSVRDFISGRIWEYIWQYVLAGQKTLCPDPHICYCDGYGLCFEDDDAFEYWFELAWKRKSLRKELKAWRGMAKRLDDSIAQGIDEGDALEIPEAGKDVALKKEIDELRVDLDERRNEAVRRGNDPRQRARIAGREWHDGDGF